MSNADFIYLASPYSHASPSVRNARFDAVCRVAAQLMREGFNVFCPIAHSHPIGEAMDRMYLKNYSTNGDFWKKQDIPILRHASALFVVTLEGYKESTGVQWETALARELGLPIRYIEPSYGDTTDEVYDAARYSVLLGSRDAVRI